MYMEGVFSMYEILSSTPCFSFDLYKKKMSVTMQELCYSQLIM